MTMAIGHEKRGRLVGEMAEDEGGGDGQEGDGPADPAGRGLPGEAQGHQAEGQRHHALAQPDGHAAGQDPRVLPVGRDQANRRVREHSHCGRRHGGGQHAAEASHPALPEELGGREGQVLLLAGGQQAAQEGEPEHDLLQPVGAARNVVAAQGPPDRVGERQERRRQQGHDDETLLEAVDHGDRSRGAAGARERRFRAGPAHRPPAFCFRYSSR